MSVVALRIELSATWLSAGYRRPAFDYRSNQFRDRESNASHLAYETKGGNQHHFPALSRVPRSRTENLLLPKQACSHLHLRPIASQNGRNRTDDLLAPSQARYQASPRSDFLVTRVGVEPNLVGLKDR